MAEPKTKPTKASVLDFIKKEENETKKKDALILLKMFKDITKEKPVMWGPTMIGFGSYHYKSERSAQEGDWLITGFSPRKQNLTLYVIADFPELGELLKKLGKHKTSVGCLYINKLADVDLDVLKQIIKKSYAAKKKYGVK
jgi:hypothetical protein